MKTFTDSQGTVRQIDLTIGTLRRVKGLLEVDLTQPQSLHQGKTLSIALATDVWLLCDVLCALVRPQLEEAGLSDEDFAARLGGGVLGEARTVLLEEWADFFRQLGRAELAAAVANTTSLLQTIGAEAIDQMEGLSVRLIASAKKQMAAEADRVLSGN